MSILSILIAVCLSGMFLPSLQAQCVDTILVSSLSMKKDIKNVVILPEGYEDHPDRRYPVVYLLHGYNNRYDSWIRKTKPELPQTASDFQVIVVCPDGQASWYWDSPTDPSSRYETYVSEELVRAIDSRYRTVASRRGRAVTGYSMGGHGALWLTFRHPDVFGACGSMSGAVDVRPFPDNWKIKEQLGEYSLYPRRWDEHMVINQLYRVRAYNDISRERAGAYPDLSFPLQPDQPAILIDCGTDDYFYRVNLELHEKMLYYHISHDFITRPGAHVHSYWREAVEYHFLFFSRYFRRQTNEE